MGFDGTENRIADGTLYRRRVVCVHPGTGLAFGTEDGRTLCRQAKKRSPAPGSFFDASAEKGQPPMRAFRRAVLAEETAS